LELMLLPQERQVLQIIKLRAKDRRQRHEYSKCLWIIALVTATFLVVATCLALKFLELELQGPL
jgi:anti-sigma-K factor RskA